MSIWDLSRNCLRFLVGFPFAGFAIVSKEPMVDGSRPEFTKLAFVAAVRYFWFLNCLHPNILWRCNDSNWVLFSHVAGVDDGGIGDRLEAYLWMRLRVRRESGSTEFLWSSASFGSLDLIFNKDWCLLSPCKDVYWVWLSICKDAGMEVWDVMDSSSDGMMCGDWCVRSGVIVDGHSLGTWGFRSYIVHWTCVGCAERLVAY